MGKSGGSAKQRVTTYRMGIHLGLCAGPIDALKEVYVSEKPIGGVYSTEQRVIDINKPDLFGGIKKEGGVGGRMTVLPGAADQLVTEEIAAKFGATPTTMEGFRGFASLFFSHTPGQPQGFYWIANSPYLRDIWAKVTRIPKGWYPETAAVYNPCLSGASLYSKRQITDIVVGSKWTDISGKTLVHLNAAGNLTIEDVRTGAVRGTITLSYTMLWCYISPSRNEILTIDTAGVLRAYDANTGALKSSLTGWGDPTPPGNSSGSLGGSPQEYVVGGVTYLLFMIPTSGSAAIVCLSSTGSGWSYNWNDNMSTIVGNSSAVMTVGPTRLAVRVASGNVRLHTWSASALGAGAVVDFSTLLGWDVTSGDAIASFSYVPGHDVWFVVARNGKTATLNADCTAVVSSSSSGAWSGLATAKAVQTRRVLNSSVAVFTDTDRAVHMIDVMTNVETSRIPFSEWGLSGLNLYWDSGFSVAENAIAVFDTSTDDGAYVLFFPDTTVDVDANPIHMIVECMTNKIWGMGGSLSQFNLPMWEAAADTIYAEKLGLSMMWTQQAKIEDFVKEILNHIEAYVYINPRTGLFEIKLIRNDYDPDTLPVLDKTNCALIDHQIKLYGESINEIVVTWTNPENEEEETVTLQDPGAIAIQGSIVSDNRNYYGLRCRSLAMSVCERDLRAVTAPLASATVDCERSKNSLTPGAVCKLNFPEHGLSNRIMRVGPVDYGNGKSAELRLSLVEDVFSTPEIAFEAPPGSEFENPSEDPAVAAFTELVTLPYFVVAQQPDAQALANPEVYAGALVAQTGVDTRSFELYGEVADALGNLSWQSLGTREIVSHALLSAPLVAEAQTTYALADLANMTQGTGPTIAGLGWIGFGDDEDMEIIAISSFTDPNYTFERGMLDTIPRDWPAGTPIWFTTVDANIMDNVQRSAGELVTYKVLPTTSRGTLDEASAPTSSETLNERPHMPLRPANVTLGGIDFGSFDARAVDPIPITWSERNRLTENTQMLLWGAATVTPEAGQTTTVVVMDLDRNVLTTHSGLTGTSFNLPHSSFVSHSFGIVRIESERDGIPSLQAVEYVVQVSSITADTGLYTADTGTLTADR